MNNASERDIDRVLTALRDTEPSAGLEARILQTLESRTLARSAWFRWTPPLQWGIATLATAAIIFAVALTNHHTQRVTPDIAQSPAPTPSTALPSANHVILSSAKGPLLPHTRTNSHSAPRELLCDCDRLAMAEMEAPSHLAPEMPLTTQERLLQRVIYHGDPIEIAELEPLRTAVPTEQDAALQRVVQGYLKQLAAAETLNPTPPASDSNDPVLDPGLSNPN